MTNPSDFARPPVRMADAMHKRWPLLTAAAVMVFAYGPLIWEFFLNLWARPHYQYFPFVLAAFACLLWRNGKLAQRREMRSGLELGAASLLVLSWLLLAASYYLNSPWLAFVSGVILIASCFAYIGRRWHVPYLWGIWAVLWLIVPLPLSRDQQLIVGLQHVSSRLSSIFLDSAGVVHLMDGNALLLSGKQFFVDEACSGIVSVLSVIACAVIYGVWQNRSPAHVVLLAVAGTAWATFMNVLRITVIAIVFDTWGIDWSTGTSHEVLGLVSFTLIFLALMSTDQVLVALLAPAGAAWLQIAGAPARVGRRLVWCWDWLFAAGTRPEVASSPPATAIAAQPMRLWPRIVPLSAFAILALLQFVPFPVEANSSLGPEPNMKPYLERAMACDAEALPSEIGPLRCARFQTQERHRDDAMGNFSRTYEYRGEDGVTYLVSLDFPYPGGWHELTVCYRGMGWELTERQIQKDSFPRFEQPWQRLEAAFSKPDGSRGFLLASAFDYAGRLIELPTFSFLDDVAHSVTSRGRASAGRSVFQVQVWATASRPITSDEQDKARQLLLFARERLYDEVLGH